MTAKEREKKNNLRKYKAAIVYNTYGNARLADAARSWSFERIKDELGIPIQEKKSYRVPKWQTDYKTITKVVELKTEKGLVKKTVHETVETLASKRRTFYQNFLTHRINGATIDKAFAGRMKKRIPVTFDGKQMDIIGDEPDWMQLWRRQSRLTKWRKWSSKNDPLEFPPYIMNFIRMFNREAGLKQYRDEKGNWQEANYGYAIVFQMTVNGWSEEAAKAHYKATSDPTIYRVTDKGVFM